MFKVCSQDQHDTSKTLTIAIQTELPIQQNLCVTCFSSIETEWNLILIPFAVADIKDKILETPFFGKFIQNNNIKILPWISNTHSMTNRQLLFYYTDWKLLSFLFIHLSNQFKTTNLC